MIWSDIRIKQVKRLKLGMAPELIDNHGFDGDDLVIVKTIIEKIEGSPSTYLQNKIKNDCLGSTPPKKKSE